MTSPSGQAAAKPPIESAALRLISYGLYLLTTKRGSEVHAITFNWLTQISFEPLLVLAAVEKSSHSHSLLTESGVFAVNFLSKEQVPLARRMAVPYRMNRHKLAGVEYDFGITGAPLLRDSLGYLECQVQQTVDVGGDHTLFVAAVVAAAAKSTLEPLTLLESRLRYK